MTILIAVISFAACSKSEGVSDNSGGNEITTDGSNLFMPSDESRKIVYTVYATIESGKFSELGDIINKDIQTEDITDKYTDASAVITAYQTELAILQQRLSEESNPSYAFQYSERITEINTIINKYQSMLNS
jgi:ABC-type Fe3+-hydroxamate transport system substrate-binding protein